MSTNAFAHPVDRLPRLVRRGRPPRRPRRELGRSRRDGDQAVRLRDLGGDPARARRPDQGDRPRELLLPAVRARLGAGAGGRARRRVRARGRRRHGGGREEAGGAARRASHLRGADLVDVRPLGAVLPRPAAALQPVGQRRPLGAAAAPLPAHDRVPLAGGAHRPRDGGGGARRDADDPPRRLRRHDRERPRDPRAARPQERERAVPRRRRHLHARSADARRKGAPGGDLALPRPGLPARRSTSATPAATAASNIRTRPRGARPRGWSAAS